MVFDGFCQLVLQLRLVVASWYRPVHIGHSTSGCSPCCRALC
jgi:hypothetical protein